MPVTLISLGDKAVDVLLRIFEPVTSENFSVAVCRFTGKFHVPSQRIAGIQAVRILHKIVFKIRNTVRILKKTAFNICRR